MRKINNSHGRHSWKHGFREASDKRRDCHCERWCTKTKTDDSQNQNTAKQRPPTPTEDDRAPAGPPPMGEATKKDR